MWDMWVQGVLDEPPHLHRCFHIHLPPHPAVLRQGRLLPAPSRCRDVPGQIPLASMLPPKTRSAGVQMCRDVLGRTERGLCRHIARAWGPRASVGSTTNPLELGRKDPSWDNPSHPSPQHGQASPSCRTPLCCPGGAWAGGVRCRRSPSRPSPAFPQPGWFHGAGRIPAGAQPKPTHSLQSDLRLGFTAPAVSGRRGSCPNPQLLPSPACVPPEPALGPRCQSSGGRTEGGAALI